MLTLTYQIAFQLLPGKQHISVFVCNGSHPGPDWDGRIKQNLDILATFVLTSVLYMYNALKIRIHKMTATRDSYEKHDMINSVSILFSLLFYPFAGLIVFGVNGLISLAELIKFPNYILIHFFQHELIFLWNFYFFINLFAKSKNLRHSMRRELKLKMDQWACSFCKW